MSVEQRATMMWWLFFILGTFIIYKVLTLDVDKIGTIEVNATVVDTAKAKLHRTKE